MMDVYRKNVCSTRPRRDRGRGHTASLQWAPQGKATVLDVRPTESPLTCLPRSGLSSLTSRHEREPSTGTSRHTSVAYADGGRNDEVRSGRGM